LIKTFSANPPYESKLGPLAYNGGMTLTHALLPGSPAIDAGSHAFCPEEDQRSYFRPFDGNKSGVAVCDIGAYEFHQIMFPVFLPLIIK
jgi:hypothetical protein